METMDLRVWREAKGLSLRDLGLLCKVDASFLAKIERREKHPGLNLAIRLAAVTGIPAERFAARGVPATRYKGTQA